RVRSSARAETRQHCLDCPPDDDEVDPERKVLDVVEVKVQFICNILHVRDMALVYLRPTAYAWTDNVTVGIEGDLPLVPLREHECLRAGANPGHFSFEHIDQLRQLVEATLAQEATDAGDTPVVVPGYRSGDAALRNRLFLF